MTLTRTDRGWVIKSDGEAVSMRLKGSKSLLKITMNEVGFEDGV